MVLKKCILTANRCYIANEKINDNKPMGIVVHSTGCNNRTLKRYVQPLKNDKDYDEIIADIGVNKYGNHWNGPERSACVHAFIGVNDAGKVETYQTLPFDICCWGVGSIPYDKNGKEVASSSSPNFDHYGPSYNYNPQARIQFEMCEDDLKDKTYFEAVMKEAQEFCAYICKMYGFGVDKISSHHESYLAGYGGNHGDPENWLKPFGKTMDWFRSEVQKLLDEDKQSGEEQNTGSGDGKFVAGDLVKIVGKTYYSGKNIPSWVLNQNWYVEQVSQNGERVVINDSEDGSAHIMSPVRNTDLVLVKREGADDSQDIIYIVKDGDTLSGIAKKYNTTYKILAEYNNIENPNLIRAGQEIRIPAAKAEPVFSVGDIVCAIEDALIYDTDKKLCDSLKDCDFTVEKVDGDKITISSTIKEVVDRKYLCKK